MLRKGKNIFKRKDVRAGRAITLRNVRQKKAETVRQLNATQSKLKKQKLAKNPNFEVCKVFCA